MTDLIYVCIDAEGNKFETRIYSEALKCKAEGGDFFCRYEEHRTY